MFLASLRGCFGDILGNVLCLVPPVNENIEEYNLQCISKQKTLREFFLIDLRSNIDKNISPRFLVD